MSKGDKKTKPFFTAEIAKSAEKKINKKRETCSPFYEVPVPGMRANVKYHKGWGDLENHDNQKRVSPFYIQKFT